jgi:cytochrome P450
MTEKAQEKTQQDSHEFSSHADVVAALADPALVPPPPTETRPDARTTPGTAAWLRANVARFASGPTHTRRRAVVEADLAGIDAEPLRLAVHAVDGDSDGDGGGDVRLIAVGALAEALGLTAGYAAARDVVVVAGVYFGGDSAEADAAVARLVDAFLAVDPDADLEMVANRIGLLVQACDSTASLVARARWRSSPNDDVDALLTSTLREDPPVRTMRRVALRDTRVAGIDIAAGDLITLDIAAASLDPDSASSPALAFGAEPRRCPGSVHAVALAAAILEKDL